jgi:hypothetical protein
LHFLGPFTLPAPLQPAANSIRGLVHLRSPSIDQGVQAGLWGIGLAVLIWLGLLAFGVSGGTSFIMAMLAGAAIFLYVRLFGGEEPQRSRR